jgi:hypothetical protein
MHLSKSSSSSSLTDKAPALLASSPAATAAAAGGGAAGASGPPAAVAEPSAAIPLDKLVGQDSKGNSLYVGSRVAVLTNGSDVTAAGVIRARPGERLSKYGTEKVRSVASHTFCYDSVVQLYCIIRTYCQPPTSKEEQHTVNIHHLSPALSAVTSSGSLVITTLHDVTAATSSCSQFTDSVCDVGMNSSKVAWSCQRHTSFTIQLHK